MGNCFSFPERKIMQTCVINGDLSTEFAWYPGFDFVYLWNEIYLILLLSKQSISAVRRLCSIITCSIGNDIVWLLSGERSVLVWLLNKKVSICCNPLVTFHFSQENRFIGQSWLHAYIHMYQLISSLPKDLRVIIIIRLYHII